MFWGCFRSWGQKNNGFTVLSELGAKKQWFCCVCFCAVGAGDKKNNGFTVLSELGTKKNIGFTVFSEPRTKKTLGLPNRKSSDQGHWPLANNPSVDPKQGLPAFLA